MEKEQKFISHFEHAVVFGKVDMEKFNVPNITLQQLEQLVQHTPNDTELGAKLRILINSTYGK